MPEGINTGGIPRAETRCAAHMPLQLHSIRFGGFTIDFTSDLYVSSNVGGYNKQPCAEYSERINSPNCKRWCYYLTQI